MQTIMKTRNILAGLALASGSLFATGASAAVIGAWDWQTDGGFVMGGSTCSVRDTVGLPESDCSIAYDNTSGVTPSTIDDTASILTWGTGRNGGEQSGLQGVFGSSVGPRQGGFDAAALGSDEVVIPEFEQIVTNGGWTNTGAAIHYNNILAIGSGNMDTAVLQTNFQLLSPLLGPPIGTQLNITFNETPNNTGSCPYGAPHGTVCDDIFTLTGALDPFTFSIDGQLYKARFRFADGPGAIVDGDTIYTAELNPGTATMFVQGRIDTIPLPGVLGLMGLGLMLIGWQVRGRRKLV